MATLSILSYNLSQGLSSMTSNENGNSGSNSNTISLPKAFNKITVQNVLSENKANALNISNNSSMISNANAIVKKIKDFGMIGAVNAVHSVSSNNNTSSNISSSSSNLATSSNSAPPRKRRLDETKANKTVTALVKPTATTKRPAFISAPKKVKICTKTSTPKSTIMKTCENANQQMVISNSPAVASTPGRKGLPAPQAVARRNARERNRVKQVNNGFAALRERIPEEVAETFEAQGTIRGTAAKKLSKVETLRMAVEYIRSLERLLGFDFPISGNQAVNESFSLIKDEFGALSPGEDDQFDDSLSNYELDEDFVTSHTQCAPNNSSLQSLGFADQPGNQNGAVDLLPNITTLNGLQYIRIPGTNTYQLLTADLFAGNSQSPPTSNIEDEQFNAIIDANCQSPRSASSATTTADLHSSPTTTTSSIMQGTAPALRQAAATSGDHVKLVEVASSSSSSPSLSRSPVPETSPSAANSSLQRRCGPSTPTLSPASNEILLQTCAADADVAIANNHHRLSASAARHFVEPILPQQQQQQQKKLLLSSQAIKQEFNETDFSFPATHSSNTSNAIIYQTIMQHQQLLLGQTSMAMSPPLDAANSTLIIPSDVSSALPDYFEHDHDGSFYEGNVTFKKEQFNEVALDATNTTPTALSDESMMEAIDWWEAHTPNSDGGSVIM